MALAAGTRLGAYEIIAAIGAGGMGEVFRARDMKLGRDVAIKTLPEIAAGDPERMARFEREAQLLAALNHPHIAAIYGIEDSSTGKFLVLELVDGESLAERLARDGALPVGEALRIASQIIDALEAAHDKGIIHRDLKPGNIMLTADGQVKVLDFGLARAMESEGPSSVSNSPTLSIAATQAGMILGTAAYMSPEQAKGRVADKRSDVWAFGCVLYEMLTGRRAFDGEDVSDTLASILKGEPDWTAFPADVPDHVRTIVRRCLARDRKSRIPDISVARYLLTEAPPPTTPAAAPAAAPAVPRGRQIAIGFAGLGLGVALAAGAWWGVGRWRPTPPPQLMRFAIVPAASHALSYSPIDRTIVISPDGTRIAYMGRTGTGDVQLMMRRVDQLHSVAFAGTSGARYPFFSADGRWIGFFATGELKKVAVTGGAAVTICRVSGGMRGGTWTRNNNVIYATNDPTTGLMIVPGAGGEPRPLTKPAQGEDHFHPSVLPDDRGVLFTIHRTALADSTQVAVAEIETGEHRSVLRGGTQPTYTRTGHLIYAVSGTLHAVRFDLEARAVVGDPVPVEYDLLTLGPTGTANYAVSDDGTLIFSEGSEAAAGRLLVWVHRDGREEPVKAEPRVYTAARLAPDGTRVAFEARDQEQDIWVLDFARQTPSRLTFAPGLDAAPTWTPDGRRIIYQSAQSGTPNLFRKAADGTGAIERLTTTTASLQLPFTLSTDGSQLILMEARPETGPDLMLLRLDGKSKPETLLATRFVDLNAELSPDGRWLAYQNNESGAPQVYVRPFPQVDSGRWQISPAGGTRPAWSRATQELFYLDIVTGGMMSVPYDTKDAFRPGNPIRLFATRYYTGIPNRSYDVSADGKRFLMIKDPAGEQGGTPNGMVLVANWFEELKAKLPAREDSPH
jgi:Tol biopolymer transport system component